MLHFFYSLVFRLALPFVLVRLWWSGRDNPKIRRHWLQRVGLVQRFREPVIWVHAVSVGETIAAAPLVKTLLRRNPGATILMTAMTVTGLERAQAIFGDQVKYAYSPYDTPGSVRRFVDRINPRALVIMETELWPNMIALTRRRQVPIFLINARLSERSARGYAKIGSLVTPLLASIRWIAAQAQDDADRFLRIGAKPETVSVTGSIKFDVDITDAVRQQARTLRTRLGEARPLWIAASTHDGEDQQILAAHQRLLEDFPEALLVIVPRHPERFESVARLIQSQGLALARRSRNDDGAGVQVYLGDTMGELLMLYGAADLAFVGGSLIERGGHNPLEPAAWGIPVLSGPHVFNFETIYGHLQQGAGVSVVADSEALYQRLAEFMRAPATAQLAGRNALAVVDANRGALNRVVDGIISRAQEESAGAA
ncbi:lipid IV(A) 3-deoxy-D-manno-octulosonic acid transferase [Marinobacter xestospongiae]|uniref:3-deoxy-D-manno-octulosonic acid transferase n=1 Tax=Marinobacter xestospongiae TaxID=994319 RepID=A0ABU3W139_9GAMM|nr:lipid IV(A) 3-deoxy-D-manno-octulosonic acid transferase [Marinobacter xestospongiae]MDV2080229.1 lipid IV(A) 3-deoxy-D-manno-octulosonic acid transferase [Marinobacter xestospongiae]